ncbi:MULTISPECIES: YbaN family protein [Aerococcus]|uniref:YbaN family protein n=1 Tax=Aerococcus urinae TaxID=1376 RepID=A0A109REG7_9LACT|nr:MULTISPECIES: YbaN family protein [Aerococcus]AMB95813.1 hypothetical protein AWM73_04510 [Aerococcus urinae]MCY3032395.1 YbaN family protein [Aerococcus urinae]MCY3037394.1 YbaN family protein [Aerococcus urinae]MCY3044441.1 YbaN family protein [Aerococcus urinae]MCY3046035.1 YbaN family protein [Aerococcus urinae]
MRYFYLILGWTSFALGALGTFIPVLPTTPFMLLAAWAFARSSKRFDQWLKSTKIYQYYGADFEDGGGIPLKKKVQIILITYTVMAISIYFVPLKPVRLLIVAIGIIFGLWLFLKMPTKKE